MHLIVCLEEHDGLHFGGRRLSSDRLVTEHILRMSGGHNLWMNAYSAKLFSGAEVCVAEDFLEKAAIEDYCFLENSTMDGYTDKIRSVTVYRWNRRYPATVRFPVEILKSRQLVHTEDFPGNSHEIITVERYDL